MKSIISIVSAVGCLGLFAASESARIRVDTRVDEVDGRIANGIELVGEADGSAVSAWNTSNRLWNAQSEYPDGAYVRNGSGHWIPKTAQTESLSSDVLVINGLHVAGGRCTDAQTWGTDTVHIVRHNVILTSGAGLTVDFGAEVRFTDAARIVVEQGAALRICGACFSDGFSGDARDWITGLDAGDYTHVLMLDGTEPIAPMRTYTKGEKYGDLPRFDRYEDGWLFRGWKTSLEAGGSAVGADDVVDMATSAVYCDWELIYVNPEKTAVEIPAYSEGVVQSVSVNSNDRWKWSADADWLTVSDQGTVSNGVLLVSASVNRSETPRSAVVRLSRANGKLVREITVTQPAMEHVATPVIETGSGDTTFSDYVETIWITCRTAGSSIYYTTDGSEPGVDNGALLDTFSYSDGIAGVINIYGTTTVKAIAVRNDMLDSSVSSLKAVRADTLASAMDIPEMYVTTGGDKLWEVATEGASDGVSCVRSGAMATAQSRRQSSRLEMVVEGSGTLTFKWKVSCERDLTGSVNWDYLAFLCDGTVHQKIDGNRDWTTVTVTLTGDTYHILTWLYTKNAAKLDIEPGEDCGWVDQVTWTPAIFAGEGDDLHEVIVDSSLLTGLGLVGADSAEIAAAATADADGDGFSNENEIILGTDPYDADSKFAVRIDSLDDESGMKVSYPVRSAKDANKNYDLTYRLLGAKELGKGFDDVTTMSEAERKEYKFFKATVDINKKYGK